MIVNQHGVLLQNIPLKSTYPRYTEGIVLKGLFAGVLTDVSKDRQGRQRG